MPVKAPTIKVNGKNPRDLSPVEIAFHITDLLQTIEVQEAGWKDHLKTNPNARIEFHFPKLQQYYDELAALREEEKRRAKLDAPKTEVVLLELQTILKDGVEPGSELHGRIPWARIEKALKYA